MGVSCQILINKPNGGHRPGQPVTGVVKYALDEPLEVTSVVLSLNGKGHCKWTETRSSNNRSRTVTYVGNDKYFTASLAVIEKNSDEVFTIPVGSYEFAFEFFLPSDIPPSYKDSIGRISYKLVLKFKRPGLFKFNKRFSLEVPVRGYITHEVQGPFIFGLEKTLSKPFSKRNHVVNLKAEADKDVLAPEEKVQLNIIVTNDTSVNITAVKSDLVRHITYTSDCGRTYVDKTIVKGSSVQSACVPKNSIANLTQEVSTLADMYTVSSRVVNVEYKLKVTVRLPLPHMNAAVEIPIVVGEKATEGAPREDPPSYWEVMHAEEKVKE